MDGLVKLCIIIYYKYSQTEASKYKKRAIVEEQKEAWSGGTYDRRSWIRILAEDRRVPTPNTTILA